MLVVLVRWQLTRADSGIERVRAGNEVGVSQVRGKVMCGGQSWRVGGRVALWGLWGHHHSANPCGILQHLQKRNGLNILRQVYTLCKISEFFIRSDNHTLK